MEKTVDVFMFMGQSNMAGRGITSRTWPQHGPVITDGAGYEFRAISDPGRLSPITEPFGVNENRKGGIDDGTMKTGSMVTSFINAYYERNGHVPVVAVSASIGGSSLEEWNRIYKLDAVRRLEECTAFLLKEEYQIRHRYMLWCQGETEGDLGTTKAEYFAGISSLITTMKNAGIEKCFMVKIGNVNSLDETLMQAYKNVMNWQEELAQTNPDVIIVSSDFAGMLERGLMKDTFHYYQQAYNEVGYTAGINAALYAEKDVITIAR